MSVKLVNEAVPEGCSFMFFFFNDTATTEIYTLSLHDALPISLSRSNLFLHGRLFQAVSEVLQLLAEGFLDFLGRRCRSEEHTSELQSQSNIVCRLLLEKKKNNTLPKTTA